MAKVIKNHSQYGPKITIKLTFQVGRVFYISAPEIIDVEEPHYFVVVAKCEDGSGYLLVSTTQLETIIRYFKKAGISEDTIATLSPSKTNGLTKQSYLNCNQLHHIEEEALESKLKDAKLRTSGYISCEEYLSIKDKIQKSEIVEPIIKKLLSEDYDP